MKDIFDPRSYGAMADGHSKDTATVQAAIDAAAAQGGTVRLAGGTFVCGTLYLKKQCGAGNHQQHDPAGQP